MTELKEEVIAAAKALDSNLDDIHELVKATAKLLADQTNQTDNLKTCISIHSKTENYRALSDKFQRRFKPSDQNKQSYI